jgi:nucleoside-diphosphate-sugar epimerase
VRPDAHIFIHNVACSFNVLQAARRPKIKNVVLASSETLLGAPFDEPPLYAPVSEDYPARPEWSYALAKHLEEQMAAQFCPWDSVFKMIGLLL